MKNNNSFLSLEKDCSRQSAHFKKKKTTRPTQTIAQKEYIKEDTAIAQGRHYDHGEPLSPPYSDEEYTASFSEAEEAEYMSYEEMPDIVEDLDADSFVEPFEDLSYEHSSIKENDELENTPDNTTDIQEKKPVENKIIEEKAPTKDTIKAAPIQGKKESSTPPIDIPKDENDTFEDDIKAILSGKKKYDASQKEVVPAAGSKNPGSSRKRRNTPGTEPDSGLPDFKKNEHDIFNKIAQNLSYSNAYDLGAIALENRFDKFDEEEDLAESKKKLNQ